MRLIRKSTFHADLRRITSHIAKDSQGAAVRMFDAIDHAVRRLSDFPELGEAVASQAVENWS